eukprot:TRINITY_DN823_c0_g1_i2.p1 TRINITY_DN823_c0_g1~~TRINITY_DN823_c0_g1_i2.p1  ORF type:complete len:1003 (+),score=224.70 TRINITY_DN823_c0_g1_i2:213-3221(+)
MSTYVCTERLKIHVLEARGLMKKDWFGKSDPYAVVQVAMNEEQNFDVLKKFKTTKKKKTLSPQWNELFVAKTPPTGRVTFDVFDYNALTKDEFLGHASVQFPNMAWGPVGDHANQTVDIWLTLRPHPNKPGERVTGELHVRCLFLPRNAEDEITRRNMREQAVSQSTPTTTTTTTTTTTSSSTRPTPPGNDPYMAQYGIADRRASSSNIQAPQGRLPQPTHQPPPPPGAPGSRYSSTRYDSATSAPLPQQTSPTTSGAIPWPPGWGLNILPPDWDERTTSGGQTVYYSHTARATTTTRPTTENTARITMELLGRSGGEAQGNDLHSMEIRYSTDPSNIPLRGSYLPPQEDGTHAYNYDDGIDLTRQPARRAQATRPSSARPRNAATNPYLNRDSVRWFIVKQEPVGGRDGTYVPFSNEDNELLEQNFRRPGQGSSITLSSASGGAKTVNVSDRNCIHDGIVHRVLRGTWFARVDGVPNGGHNLAPLDESFATLVEAHYTLGVYEQRFDIPGRASCVLHPDGRGYATKIGTGQEVQIQRGFFGEGSEIGLTVSGLHVTQGGAASAGYDSDEEAIAAEERRWNQLRTPTSPSTSTTTTSTTTTTTSSEPSPDDSSSDTLKEGAYMPVQIKSRGYARKLNKLRVDLKWASGECNVMVNRANLLESSFESIMKLTPTDLKKHLKIQFGAEKGLDYGGLAREWFFLLSHEIFNPYYCLFEKNDNYTLQINPLSAINEHHLDYFKFVGRVLGMAIFHHKFMDGYFIPPFYKKILSKKVTLKDLETVDPEYHQSMRWILDNDITDVLDLTFNVDHEEFGAVKQIDLKPNGENIAVDNNNKAEYVDLVVQWRFTRGVEEQYNALVGALFEVVPRQNLAPFDEKELELLISGVSNIDVKDWKKHTEYRNFMPSSKAVKFFWRFVEESDHETRARLLQFVTGTSRVPPEGFQALMGSQGPKRFCIDKMVNKNALPRSHTCFNRIDLPPYESYEKLKDRLTMAICETEGFGVE